MTKRAVLLGLLFAALLAGITHVNNNVMRQSGLIEDFMPIGVYGLLVLSLLTLNPLLNRIRPEWRLRGNEYAVILAISLVACSVPNSGFMRFFPNVMMRPYQWVKTKTGWQREAVLQKVPGYMIAGRSPKLSPNDIIDPISLAQTIVGSGDAEGLTPSQRRFWGLLSDDRKDQIASSLSSRNEAALAVYLAQVLNPVLARADLFQSTSFPSYTLTPEAQQILLHLGSDKPGDALKNDSVQVYLGASGARAEHLIAFNRHLLDSAWPASIRSRAALQESDLSSYLMGSGDLNKPLPVSEVPWATWVRPLLFWLPVFLIMSIGVISLSLVIHQQWSNHERLPYPLIKFTTAMLPDNEGNSSKLFMKPSFWWAGGITFAIFMFNYVSLQFPDVVPSIPLHLDFSALQEAFHFSRPGLARWALLTVRVIPISIGIAYLVRSDVSLSVGISVPMSFMFFGALAYFGVNMQTKTSGGGLYSAAPVQLLIAGAALAFALQVFYYGRSYYTNVMKRAFFMKGRDDTPQLVIISARVFFVCALALVAYLKVVGVDIIVAVLYILLAYTLFLVMARVVAETGIFFYMAGWYPCVTILGLLGINAVGPGIAILMFLFSTVLLVRPKEALMPFAVGALKVLENRDVKLFRTVPWLALSIILAIIISVPIAFSYIHGTGTGGDNGWTIAVSRYSFQKAAHMSKQLKATGRYEEVEATGGLSRIARIEPDPKNLIFFALGGLAVLGLSLLRLRWRKWPLHPVLVLVMFVQPTVGIWHSFLIGWLIRLVVIRFGGHRAYSKITPIMIGLIAGNILGLLLPNIVGAIYYFASGGQRLVSPPMF